MQSACVLVVDDIDFNIEFTARLLDALDIQVMGANSGKEALALLERRDYALILMDVQMPEMNGFDCVSRIRQNPRWQHIPVIFVTSGSDGQKYTGEGYKLGAVDYLLRPIDPDVLQSKVRVFVDLYYREKKLQRALAEVDNLRHKNELLLNYTTEYTAEGILGLDLNHCITFANNAACLLLGQTKEKLVGTGIQQFIAPNLSEEEWRQSDFVRYFYASQSRQGQEAVFWKNAREPFSVEYSQATIIDAGTSVGSVVAFQDITKRKKIEQRLVCLARFDQLTGLSNRSVYWEHLTNALSRAQRYQGTVALLFIDLDQFKQINDSQGHDTGDRLLVKASERIREALRDSDLVCRMGGDEFAVVITDPKNTREAAHVAEKILHSLKRSFLLNHCELNIGCSIGIALYPENGQDAAALTKAADTAMYYAKECGRSQYQFYSDEMQQRIKHQMDVANDLRVAIESNLLELYYQPQVDLKTGRLVGLEALLRWHHRDLGMISPSTFVSIAESTGLIQQLGEWTFCRATSQMREWVETFGGCMRTPLSVNASAMQLKGSNFADFFVSLLNDQKLPPGLMDVELTEAALIAEPASAIGELEKVRRHGVKILVDDFGTGYSSLGHLKRLPIDVLKVDGSFVRNIGQDANCEAVVQAIIKLAHTLGLKVTAEGVETDLQLNFIRREACDYAQGYFFNHPVDAARTTQILAEEISRH